MPSSVCAGCGHVFEVGDLFIEDTPQGFIGEEVDPEIGEIIAGILGGSDGRMRYCEDCTEEGGDHLFETFYGDEAEPAP